MKKAAHPRPANPAPGDTLPAARLDARSSLPLHAQAEQWLRQLVERPEYRQGGLLPDEVTLAARLGISRNTLRAAIGRLVQEGRLERKSGVGTWVLEPRIQSGVNAWHSFTREMAAKGIAVETFTTDCRHVCAPPDAVRALRLNPGTEVLRLDRLRGWDRQPMVHFRSYFHPRLALAAADSFELPLYEMLHQRFGIVADQSSEDLAAVAADRTLARLLKVKAGTPLLRRERTVLDNGGRPLEFAVVHYRCDRFRLSLQLRQT
jgi:GntR family transcriptional regulator